MNRLVAAGLHIRSCDLQGAIKMPLVILCGAPKSGKSAFAEILNSFLLLHKKPTEIVQEERLNDEKKSRSALLACVERSLSRENFVIVDSTNHIKGFRYQLFCLARAASTPHAVIFLSGTLAGEDWSEMEIPNNQNRWDNPLFFVSTCSSDSDKLQVFSDILSALEKEPTKKPSLAAQIPEKITALTPEYLASIERETSTVMRQLSLRLRESLDDH